MRSRLRTPTHCVNGHKFTRENTYIRKNGHRQCRACARFRTRRQQERRRAEGRARVMDPAWFRDYRQRVAAGLHVPQTKVVRQQVTANIRDVLEIDGGWLTALGVAHHIGCKSETVERTLFRLRQRGEVTSRIVALAGSDIRLEWRANPPQNVIATSYGDLDDVG